jgi:hypothetical protein
MMDSKKYYENKIFIYSIQSLTILLMIITTLELTFKVMLIFGYIMLFQQRRWHKHLLIMFIMIIILFSATFYQVKL